MKQTLCERAKKARSLAYTPYSNFKVGAALLCDDGTIYTGCNIENASYSPTVCAERVAFFKAISDGKQKFSAIAVCGGKGAGLSDKPCFPCGVCRQVMREFCDDGFKLYIMSKDDIKEYSLSDILPFSFGVENIEV